jgi:type III secretion protein V
MSRQVLSTFGWLSHWLDFRGPRDRLSRYSSLAVTTLVAVSVGMMIVPLPTFLLDLLISLNIAIAVTMLLIAIYVGDALRIATFPSLLLLSTLFRLSLEVSATRLILLKANAGQVIHAFGSYVVAGNLVVGIVVFLILTAVQFIVIAKGAERVAEVGARFTLDALPGKQMAIDAELRAGYIDAQEAHSRRTLLVRESQFFGAMDGAMKFVKGDAIAGIVILLTNMVGGLVIGLVQRGLDLGSAVRTYTLLTIGEGLVAQIPALVISTGAGLVVTRVSSDKKGAHLGGDIAEQVLAQPKALAFSAVLLAALALVPGLPAVPFLLLAVGLGFVAYWLFRRDRNSAAATQIAAGATLLDTLTLDLSSAISEELRTRLDEQWLSLLGRRFFDESGIPLPAVRLREVNHLPADTYAIRLHEVVLATGRLTGNDNPKDAIADHFLRVLRRHGHTVVGIDETQGLLDRLARTHPHLVREVVPKVVTSVLLAEILQCLAKEGVSLRCLALVLEALARRSPLHGSAAELADSVRTSLQRQITSRFARPDGSVPVFLVDSTIEETLRESIQKSDSGPFLALEPELGRDIIDAVGRTVKGANRPVIVTASDIRRHLRGLIEDQHPDLAVLAFQELLPEAKLETLGQITVEVPASAP